MTGGSIAAMLLVIVVLLVLTQEGGVKTWFKAKALNRPA